MYQSERPDDSRTMLQWAGLGYFPIDPDRSINVPFCRHGKIVRMDRYYDKDNVRRLTRYDEDYLCKHYRTYKRRFPVPKQMTLDGVFPDSLTEIPTPKAEPKKPRTAKKPRKEPETVTDMRVTMALINTPFVKRDDVSTLIAYDTETTGTGNTDELLQIAIIDENCSVLFSSYVKPYFKKEWPGAEKVNHISPEMVQNAPYPHEIAPKVRDIMLSADKILGYNIIRFDNRVIRTCLGIDILGKELIDPYPAFLKLPTKSGRHKLEDAVQYYCPEYMDEYLAGAHDAATDIIATMRVYEAMEKQR